MTYLTATDLERRARLQALIDRKDAERGRPLTGREKLRNLYNATSECDSDCASHIGFACDCGAVEFSQVFARWR